MKPPRGSRPSPAPIAPPEVSAQHRTMLADAYKTGLIVAWKRDIEHGYCLAVAGQPDVYVGLDQLTGYLERLRAI